MRYDAHHLPAHFLDNRFVGNFDVIYRSLRMTKIFFYIKVIG